MNPRIDARLQRDLDAKGFDKVSELGCRHYALKFDEFNRQCVAWISCQLELARTRARYDHDEQEAVEEYQDQLAQCRQLAREVSARVNHEMHELVPAPPAIPKGKDTGDEVAIDKNKRTWAEVLNGALRFAYWIHARTGLFVMINTDSNRKIDSHEVIGIFKRDVDEKELNALLVKGKPLTMKTLEAVNDLCAQKSVAARVSVDMNGGPLPERDFELDGRKWKFMQRGPTTWYDCELRKGAYLSLLISDGAIADAFVAISGRLRKESADTKARVMAILDKNPKPTIENLRAFFATLAPNHAVTARVASEKSGLVPRSDFSDGNHVWSVQEGESSYLYKTKVAANTWLLVNVEIDNKIDSVWLEDALMRQRSSKANNQLHEFLTHGTRPIATYDAFNTLVKIASRDRSFSLSAIGSLTALEVIQARVDFEQDMITNENEMPNVLKVCKGELMRHRGPRVYSGDLASYCNESVHVAVSIDMGLSAFRVYLEGNLMTNKRCSLRFPFTYSALVAYVEAELCGVID